MLDLLRKKARSWVTYIIFAGLIVVFALFFGYTDLGQTSLRQSVATVNGREIPRGAFDLALENSEAYYRQMFHGELPAQLLDGMRQSTLQQLIQEQLLVDFARRHRLVISDRELATTIRQLPFLRDDAGQFDPIIYHERILPAITQQYQINFETWVRDNELATKVRDMVEGSITLSPDELATLFRRERTTYTFEIARFDTTSLVETKKLGTAEEVTKVAAAAQAVFHDTKARRALLEPYGIDVTTVGPVSVRASNGPLGAEAKAAETMQLFQLREPGENCPGPFTVGTAQVICRLITRTPPTDDEWRAEEAGFRDQVTNRFVQQQLGHLLESLSAHASIHRAENL